MYLALAQQTPALEKMVEMAKGGKAQTPEFGALATKTSKTGPILGIMLLVLIILMVLKPGS